MTSLPLGNLPDLQTLLCAQASLTSLDIRGVGDNLTTLRCGDQMRVTGTLALTLTPAQKEKWDESWSKDNGNVILDVRERE